MGKVTKNFMPYFYLCDLFYKTHSCWTLSFLRTAYLVGFKHCGKLHLNYPWQGSPWGTYQLENEGSEGQLNLPKSQSPPGVEPGLKPSSSGSKFKVIFTNFQSRN